MFWVIKFTPETGPRDPERIGLFDSEDDAKYWLNSLFPTRTDMVVEPGDSADYSLTEVHRYLRRND